MKFCHVCMYVCIYLPSIHNLKLIVTTTTKMLKNKYNKH